MKAIVNALLVTVMLGLVVWALIAEPLVSLICIGTLLIGGWADSKIREWGRKRSQR